jgi:SAM-dependent methyltransferase
LDVTAVDPAAASLEVARTKSQAEQVEWIHGDVASLPPLQVDLATMSGNVAQVFLTDDQWTATLIAAGSALRPGGHLVFECRDPAREAWREWSRRASYRQIELPEIGALETWVDLLDVDPPFVSFRWTFIFGFDGAVLTSDSTLRFREQGEITDSLGDAGFVVEAVLDTPDRPGQEFVFVATSAKRSPNPKQRGRPGPIGQDGQVEPVEPPYEEDHDETADSELILGPGGIDDPETTWQRAEPRGPLPTLAPGAFWLVQPGEDPWASPTLPKPRHFPLGLAVSLAEIVVCGGRRRSWSRTPHGRSATHPDAPVAHRMVVLFVQHRARGNPNKSRKYLVIVDAANEMLGWLDYSDSWGFDSGVLMEVARRIDIEYEIERFQTEPEFQLAHPNWVG